MCVCVCVSICVAISWLQAFVLSISSDFFIITPIAIFARVVILPRIVSYAVFQGDPDIASLSNTPLMSGAVGALGPTGQAAYALGLASVAAVGTTGYAARKWLHKTRDQERRKRIQSKVRYIQDESDPYKVTCILEKDRVKKRFKHLIKKYVITPDKGLEIVAELQTAVSNREQRLHEQRKGIRESVEIQNKESAQQVDTMTNEVIMNTVMQLLLQGFVEPEARQEIVDQVEQQQNNGRSGSRKDDKLLQDVAAAVPGANEAILSMVLEMLTEEALSTLTGGKHIPGQHQLVRNDVYVKSKTNELAEFYMQMGLNRRKDDIMLQRTDENTQAELVEKEHAREQREQNRKQLIGNKKEQRKLLEKSGGSGGDFGSGTDFVLIFVFYCLLFCFADCYVVVFPYF